MRITRALAAVATTAALAAGGVAAFAAPAQAAPGQYCRAWVEYHGNLPAMDNGQPTGFDVWRYDLVFGNPDVDLCWYHLVETKYWNSGQIDVIDWGYTGLPPVW